MAIERKQLSEESTDEEKENGQQKDGYVISDEKRNTLLKRIKATFADTAVISDPDFNLSKLAELVESNTKYVSVVINEECHKSFKSMLTECRIKKLAAGLTTRNTGDTQYGPFTKKWVTAMRQASTAVSRV